MHIRAISTMVLSQLKRAVTSVSLKIFLATAFFLLALAATSSGGIFQGWYIFEPFFLSLHGSLFVLASMAFLIAATRQIFGILLLDDPIEYDGEPAIPTSFDPAGTQWVYYLHLPWPPAESQPVYEPIIPTGIDSA